MNSSPGWRRPGVGATLIEMLVSTTMYFLMLTLIFGGYSIFMRCWRASEAKLNVHRKFLLLSSNFQHEIIRTDLDTVECGLTSGKNWIYFKSDVDNEGTPHLDNEGKPRWTKYVLYYAIRPPRDKCLSPVGEEDDICPHKYIIRKDINIAAALSGEGGLKRHLTFTLTMRDSEPYVMYVKPICNNILTLSCHKDSVKVYAHLKVVRIRELSRNFVIGGDSLLNDKYGQYVNEFIWATIPRN